MMADDSLTPLLSVRFCEDSMSPEDTSPDSIKTQQSSTSVQSRVLTLT